MKNNIAERGGCINLLGTTLISDQNIFLHNYASFGGVIYAIESNFKVRNSTFHNNLGEEASTLYTLGSGKNDQLLF